MVDRVLLAARIAAVRDAVARIREVLPAHREAFAADRTTRDERELSAEIQSHLDLHIDDNIRAGMTPQDARRAALVKVGPVEAIREEYRDRSSLPRLEAFRRDAAFGFRALRRQPGFALAAITTLAIGIGANAAVFSVVDAVLLRPLPYPAPDRIVRIDELSAAGAPAVAVSQGLIEFGPEPDALALRPELRDSSAFTAIGVAMAGAVNVGRDPAERLRAAEVAPELFDVMGIGARTGRVFTADDMKRSKQLVVISDRLWRELLGVRGASFRGKDRAPWAEIVGVVRDVRMRGPARSVYTAVYVPHDVDPGSSGPAHLVVRAKANPAAVVPSIRTAMRTLDPSIPAYNAQTFDEITASLMADRRFAMIMMTIFAGLGFILAIIGLYGVISCLVHVRTREIGIRLAIGASRSRIRRQVLGSGLAHASGGILLGGALVAAGSRTVATRVPALGSPDPVVIGGIAVLILVVAAAATWFPAARATRIDPALTLRAE